MKEKSFDTKFKIVYKSLNQLVEEKTKCFKMLKYCLHHIARSQLLVMVNENKFVRPNLIPCKLRPELKRQGKKKEMWRGEDQ